MFVRIQAVTGLLFVGLSGMFTRTATATPPSIAYPPRNQTVVLYQQASFGVIASGTAPFTYQWRKDGVAIDGATNDQLVLPHGQFSDAGQYSVIVSNAEDRVTSADAALTVNAPVGGDVDCSFACGGSINGGIASVARQADGRLLIGGNFSTVNGAVRGRVARLHADGSIDFTFMNGMAGISGYGWVNAVAVQSDGKVLIAGEFTGVNGVSRNSIARLNRDGSVDSDFQNGLAGVSGWINAIALQSDGRILIGGYFYKVNGVDRKSLARLNADGTLDTAFLDGAAGVSELATNIAGTVHSLAVQSDGKVLVGGVFYTVNGARRANVARLNSDGTLDSGSFNQVPGVDSWVTALAVQPDGKVLVGGPFLFVEGERRSGIARLNADGSLDGDFLRGLPGISNATDEPFPTTTRIVYSLGVQSDGKILIGGQFTMVNGALRNGLARVNADGTLDDGFPDVGFPAFAMVHSVNALPGGDVLAAGSFETVNGESRHDIAQFHSDGSLDNSFHDGLSQRIYGVYSVAPQDDGKVVIGGEFTTVNGIARSNIARLDGNGAVDNGFQNGLLGANGPVQCVALQTDGKVLIGGDFSEVNGESRHRVARLNSDGTLDSGFQNGLAGANGSVLQLATQSNGKVLIQGRFSRVNGENRTNFARLNADGTLDSGFPIGLATDDTDPDCPDGTIHSIAFQSDGKVIVGGGFITINGVSRTNLARFDPDGTLDNGFQIDFAGIGSSICPNPHGAVYSVAVQSDDKILIGGDFSSVNDAKRINLARLNADGSVDTGFRDALSETNWYGYVYSVALQSDGRILIAGTFSVVNGAGRNSIARLHADGTLDVGFLNGLSGSDGAVNWIAPQGDGKVLIGRGFTAVNGVPVFDIARLWYPLEIKCRREIGGDVTLSWPAISNRTYRVQYKDQLSATCWKDLSGNILASGAIASKTDTTLSGAAQRFYQVVLVP